MRKDSVIVRVSQRPVKEEGKGYEYGCSCEKFGGWRRGSEETFKEEEGMATWKVLKDGGGERSTTTIRKIEKQKCGVQVYVIPMLETQEQAE